ncbi:hypothetical protein [Halorussus halophilus]|uniref:hypothetical protein n=1 Tax=Halorussus halophilus TaxID=2650975 RepID=UPI001300DA36|nr:hypothetical protein [Halorussus halophilus]
MALREQIPKPLRGPVGFMSLFVMLAGVVIGYVLTVTGITLYFGLQPFPEGAVSSTEALTVMVVGFAVIGVGYAGWRGFNYFAY